MKREKMLKRDWPFEDCPQAFADYFRYVHSLGFYTKPNYRIIRGKKSLIYMHIKTF